eukprot:s1564_g11.t1
MADATLKALRKKLGDLEDELDAVTEAKVELEEQVNSLKSELEAARGEDLRAALEDLQARHESELKQAQSAKEELEQALSSKADLEAKIAALQEGVTSPVAADAASESLADERARSEKLQAEVRELTARNDALEEQLASNAEGERQHSDLREELEQERQQRQSLETELQDLRRTRDDLDDALEKSRASRKADGAECERLSQVCQELESDRDMALERMQSAERLAAAKSANLEEMQSTRASEAARADALAKELEVAAWLRTSCCGAAPSREFRVWMRWPEQSLIFEPVWEPQPMQLSIMRYANMFETYFVLREAKQRVVGGQTFQDVDSFNLRFMDRFMVFHAEATLHASFAMRAPQSVFFPANFGPQIFPALCGTVYRMQWALVLCSALAVQAEPAVEVHIVPHTHDDVGWLKTVDEYFTGQNNSIQTLGMGLFQELQDVADFSSAAVGCFVRRAYVRLILDTVVRCLEQNPDRKFTYVETAFFARWWRQQDNSTRQLVRRLVSSGQLEFSNGGWCMHDEAATHFLDMIDQTTLGHKFLMDELGAAPRNPGYQEDALIVFPSLCRRFVLVHSLGMRTGWQLDPFGHSATQAALLSAEDLELRREKKEAEFIWRASPSLGSDAQVFTGLTGEYGGNYGPPAGFDWDDYNVKSRVDDFVAVAMVQANQTRGRHIMMTMGSDFQYEDPLKPDVPADAFTWFYNLDKLIHHVNADGRVHAFYSTPGMYVDAKKSEKITWPTKEDDFFPYADGPHQFWTGYFTSRPALKRYIRDTSAFFQVVKQISVIRNQPASQMEGLDALAEAMGVAQHHDAASGTAKQHVTFDYAKRLAKGRAAALQGDFVFCDLRNVSVCAPTQAVGKTTQRSCFTLWNGLGHAREEQPKIS